MVEQSWETGALNDFGKPITTLNLSLPICKMETRMVPLALSVSHCLPPGPSRRLASHTGMRCWSCGRCQVPIPSASGTLWDWDMVGKNDFLGWVSTPRHPPWLLLPPRGTGEKGWSILGELTWKGRCDVCLIRYLGQAWVTESHDPIGAGDTHRS